MSDDQFPVIRKDGLLRITPTDVASYVGREQCQRMLRLKLYEGNRGGAPDPYRAAGVGKQTIPQLRKRKGAEFERHIESLLGGTRLGASPGARVTAPELIEAARLLGRGEQAVFLQAPLCADIDGWRVNGISDLIRLEGTDDGGIEALIVDIKATARPLVEHLMQIAFYERMVRAVFRENHLPEPTVRLGVLYRGPVEDRAFLDKETRERLDAHRSAAESVLGLAEGYLDLIEDPSSYAEDADRFVFAADSHAAEAARLAFDGCDFHLESRCDGCDYGEICMANARHARDLSLVPGITLDQKRILHAEGIMTVEDLAALHEPGQHKRNHGPHRLPPTVARGKEDVTRRLARQRAIGPRLEPLVYRAQVLRHQADPSMPRPVMAPGGTPSSLPLCRADRHPNLVTVYLNVQVDPLSGRAWMLGSLVTAAVDGKVPEDRIRSIVEIAPAPPDSAEAERDLLLSWLTATLEAVSSLVAADHNGERSAPIHLVLWSERERTRLLEVLRRHTEDARGQTALGLFLDPVAMTATPLVTILRDDVLGTKELPLLCHTVQSVSSILGFSWGDTRKTFRERLFDDRAPEPNGDEDEPKWVQVRPRFSSEIPAEYAYAAWGDLESENERLMAPYRRATRDELWVLGDRWLHALRHIASRLRPHPWMEKASFPIPALEDLQPPQASFAHALRDFLFVDRMAEVANWKQERSFTPEERALAGVTLLASYHAGDQDANVAEQMRNRREWQDRRDARVDIAKAENPNFQYGDPLPGDEEDPAPEALSGTEITLRLRPAHPGVPLVETLAAAGFRAGDRVVIRERWEREWTSDDGDTFKFTYNPSKLVSGARAEVIRMPQLAVGDDPVLVIRTAGFSGRSTPPFTFGSFPHAFRDGETYTLDEDPNNPSDLTAHRTIQRIIGDPGTPKGKPEPNRLVTLLGADELRGPGYDWPERAVSDQLRFLAGLDAINVDGGIYRVLGNARRYIGEFGDSDLLLIQGPPGSGKSSTTAFALLARMQGAMAAGIPLRVFLSANTHAAVNVLLGWVVKSLDMLRDWRHAYPETFRQFFNPALLDVPVYRLAAHPGTPAGVTVWDDLDAKLPEPVNQRPVSYLQEDVNAWSFSGGATGSGSRLLGSLTIPRNQLFDLLVLDEASRMSLPEAVVAAKPLLARGRVIVVGDHRQMQPITARTWEKDPERVFDNYAPFRSVYDALADRNADRLPLEESFRVHRDVAEFLRAEIYSFDDVHYHSRRQEPLPWAADDSSFVASALHPDHPMVLVRHGERDSQTRNDFEAVLAEMLLSGLLRRGKDVREGLGVVVPHTAQKAAIGAVLAGKLPEHEAAQAFEAVDTVERFQGGERDAIVVSATESDPVYLLASNGFLYDPNRLTVALSRARQKLVLIAAGSVFELFSPDSETYRNIELWRSIPRTYCTEVLWRGDIPFEGRSVPVEVLGRRSSALG